MTSEAARFVGKRTDQNDTIRRRDFTKDLPAPHDLTIRILHAVVVDAADAEIHVRLDDLDARRAPPLRHVLRLGEAFPQTGRAARRRRAR